MATTNAAITQTNNALKNMNVAARARANAEAGVNVSQNLAKMNQASSNAARGLQNASKKFAQINMREIANKLNSAAKAAEAASTAAAVRKTIEAMNMTSSAMVKNLNLVNAGKPPANAAGIV
jgi:hypothetical protein